MTKWIVCAMHTHTLTQAERLCKDMVRRNAHTFGCLGQAYMGGGWHGWGGRFGRGVYYACSNFLIIHFMIQLISGKASFCK